MLSPSIYYPIWPPHLQYRKFQQGETTHKLPADMTELERRRVEMYERARVEPSPSQATEKDT